MIPHINQWRDYGLGLGFSEDTDPEDWRAYGLANYGAYADYLGMISADEYETPIAVEADQALYGNQVLARTPILEFGPKDYRWLSVMRRPYAGMLGLGDDGTIYEYDGTLGFFRKLFRRAKKAVKRVGRRIRRGVKRVLRKIPGGKYLMRLGKKVFKIAHKLVKPLAKYVGKYAAKLAPVAALIPGYGPAIAGALYSAGKIANLMNKYGAKIRGAAGTVRKLSFKSGKSAKRFQRDLKKAASKMARKGKRRKRTYRAARRYR